MNGGYIMIYKAIEGTEIFDVFEDKLIFGECIERICRIKQETCPIHTLWKRAQEIRRVKYQIAPKIKWMGWQ